MKDKSTSLHHTDNKNGLCVVLSHSAGKRWKISATPIPLGHGDNPCPQVSAAHSRTVTEMEIDVAIAKAKASGKKLLTLNVNGHDVELITKNVMDKIAHAHAVEESYSKLKRRKK